MLISSVQLLTGVVVLLDGFSRAAASNPQGVYAKYFRRMEKVKKAHDASLRTLQARSANRAGSHYAMQ
ncbi:hypothetical protein FOZ63_015042, partial [Perkinsus olseni]